MKSYYCLKLKNKNFKLKIHIQSFPQKNTDVEMSLIFSKTISKTY